LWRTCAYGHKKRNYCVFQPMLMRRALRSVGLPAAEFLD
jgi:hypothetical protein